MATKVIKITSPHGTPVEKTAEQFWDCIHSHQQHQMRLDHSQEDKTLLTFDNWQTHYACEGAFATLNELFMLRKRNTD